MSLKDLTQTCPVGTQPGLPRQMHEPTLDSLQEPPKHILVMEDNDDLRRLYGKIFKNTGYDVYPAATLEEARSLLAMGHMDIILCDIHMGNENSTDLLREQAASLGKNGTKIIVVSGQAQYRPICEEMGVDFYLEKPVGLETLLSLVERLADRQSFDR
jgi:DNA-binding response OmpR family regulator